MLNFNPQPFDLFRSLWWIVGGRRGSLHAQHGPARVDWPGVRPEKAEALLQVPDLGAGEGVPLQCLCVQAEALGAGQESSADRAAGEF